MQEFLDEDFIKIWNSSPTIAEVARQLGLRPALWYKQLNTAALRLGLTKEHMTGRGHRKGEPSSSKLPISDLLVEGSSYNGSNLRKRLVREGLLRNECSFCGITEWCGKELSLELDHINGVHNDNRIENLRILCPNCHSQTSTYCGKNRKTTRHTRHKWMSAKCACGEVMTSQSKMCLKCRKSLRRRSSLTSKDGVDYTPQEVYDLVCKHPYLTVRDQLGVGDNTIRKFLKYNGFEPPKKNPDGTTKIS